jgi:sensor histidine kinase YesM
MQALISPWEPVRRLGFITILCKNNSKKGHLRNRKHFSCFYRVIETCVEVWEKREIAWKHEHEVRVFPRNFEFLKGNIFLKSQRKIKYVTLVNSKTYTLYYVLCALGLFGVYWNSSRHMLSTRSLGTCMYAVHGRFTSPVDRLFG